MTLVLTVVAGRYVVQVSDRLTTTGGGITHDPRANKSVVLRSPDGVFAISYSGLAYFDGTPTDEWIASTFVGMPLGTRGFGGAPWKRVPNVGLALMRLRDALAVQYANLPIPHHAYWYAIAAGWQGTGRAKRAIAYEVSNRSAAGRDTFLWAPVTPRPTIPSGKFALMQSPHVLTADEVDQLRARLREADPDDPAEAETALVQCVRAVASRSKVVGPHCMAIALSPAIQPFVRCRFIPGSPIELARPGEGGFVGKQQTLGPSGTPAIPEGAPVGYTPLVIAPAFVHFPSVMVGSFVAGTRDVEISFEGPAAGVERVFLGTHLRRPPA